MFQSLNLEEVLDEVGLLREPNGDGTIWESALAVAGESKRPLATQRGWIVNYGEHPGGLITCDVYWPALDHTSMCVCLDEIRGVRAGDLTRSRQG